ncbi:MAG: hypothetical protein AB1523_07790 [Bacillota bacterium]
MFETPFIEGYLATKIHHHVRYVKDRSGWTITAAITTQSYAFSSRSDGVDAFLQCLEQFAEFPGPPGANKRV